ncbi:FkbM family methyltransferase [Polynucleobacter asymbioticus]|jgi:FkbM family methyltransferase|uniref:Methyltransferase FkbM domain-containing protein n=1 Tax=Polynucleobacter asymbioticus TaxID=576611 RepID=A0AAC9NI29_9BURK|nr:FkbM family methyltransferase [Polynucleobacter asymbioticus]APB98191.1 hypothetical protein A4F89_01990 [Polynucleobacter asymbioticus]APC00477.1 hypothetical protein AOC25_01995 [Polynucleobacter asymbioticus]
MNLGYLNKLINSISSSLFEENGEQILAISPITNTIKFNALDKIGPGGGSSGWIRSKHFNGDVHEPATIAALLYLAHQDGKKIQCLYDIGALYGYFSFISNAIFKDLEVYSFEMNPQSFISLKKNAEKNITTRKIKLINVGLSDHSELEADVKIEAFTLLEAGNEKLDLLTVDKFSSLTDSMPDLLKIDVEGYQSKIIPGSMEVIKKNKPYIIAEFDGLKTMKSLGATNKQVFEPLFDLGYKMFWCKNHRSKYSKFIEVSYEDFSEYHEVNSLALFEPNLTTQ